MTGKIPVEDNDALIASTTEFLSQMTKACKFLRMYPGGHSRTDEAAKNIETILRDIHKITPHFTLALTETHVAANGVLLDEVKGPALSMIEIIRSFHIDSVVIESDVGGSEVRDLVALFARQPTDVIRHGQIDERLLRPFDKVRIGQVKVAILNEEQESLLQEVLPDIFAGRVKIEPRANIISLPMESLEALVGGLEQSMTTAMERYGTEEDSAVITSAAQQCFAVAMPLFMNHGLGDVESLARRILAPLGEDGVEIVLGKRMPLERAAKEILKTVPAELRSEMFVDDLTKREVDRQSASDILHQLFDDVEVARIVRMVSDLSVKKESGGSAFNVIMDSLALDSVTPAPLAMLLMAGGACESVSAGLAVKGVSSVALPLADKLGEYVEAFSPPVLWIDYFPHEEMLATLGKLREGGYAGKIFFHSLASSRIKKRELKKLMPCEVAEGALSGARIADMLLAALLRKTEDADEARREERQAKSIQKSLLPDGNAVVDGFEVAHFYEPCAHVGGDYYDIINTSDGRTFFIVADVAGKGPSAALIMVLFRSVLHTLLAQGLETREVLSQLNDSIYRDTHANLFVTAFIAVCKKGMDTVKFFRAGHTPGVFVDGKGEVSELNPAGSAFGVAPSEDFMVGLKCHEAEILPGDTILLYTDGVTEAQNGRGEEFGRERLLEVVALSGIVREVGEITDRLLSSVEQFESGSSRVDDITIMAIRKR